MRIFLRSSHVFVSLAAACVLVTTATTTVYAQADDVSQAPSAEIIAPTTTPEPPSGDNDVWELTDGNEGEVTPVEPSVEPSASEAPDTTLKESLSVSTSSAQAEPSSPQKESVDATGIVGIVVGILAGLSGLVWATLRFLR